MQLVLLTFLIAVLNLGLGYGIGVYFRAGPPTLRDAWAALRQRPTAARFATPQIEATEQAMQELEHRAARFLAISSPAESVERPTTVPEGSLTGEQELSPVELLRRSAGKALPSLGVLAARLQQIHQQPNDTTAWNFASELQEICEPYLRAVADVAERLFEEPDGHGEPPSLTDEAHQVVLEQLAQLETTLSNLQHIDFGVSHTSDMARLRSDTANTLLLARRLLETLEALPAPTERQDDIPAAA